MVDYLRQVLDLALPLIPLAWTAGTYLERMWP